MLHPLSLYPPYPIIIMQKRHQKQTGEDHPLLSIRAPSQQQNKFPLFTRSSLSLSLSLSLCPFYLLPIIPSNWKTVRPLTGSPEPLHIRERVSQEQNFQDKASKTEKKH
jgi:hypothetical protein